MKISLAAIAAFGAIFSLSAVSFAQNTTAKTTTSEYTETRSEGNQVVTFPGDTLPGDTNSAYGFTIRRPPGVIRCLLIQPRFNFIPEMLKSVENL